MSKTTRKTGAEAIAFLDAQRLDATPHNYDMAYRCVTGRDADVTTAVRLITEDGVRITQAEADEIMKDRRGGPLHDGNKERAAQASLRHMMLKVAELVKQAAVATGQMGRDMDDGMRGLPEGDALAIMVRDMIERSARTEADLKTAAAETERLRQDLEAARNDAMVDALTGLPNRRAVDALLDDMGKRGVRRAIAFCDVDHFKRVNDVHGHGVGDRVLRSVSADIAAACAPHVTARWGGEEFVVVMEGLDAQQAHALIDKAREVVAARRLALRENDAPLGTITFSAGIAVTDAADGTDAVGTADALLYQAKSTGRNKVISS